MNTVAAVLIAAACVVGIIIANRRGKLIEASKDDEIDHTLEEWRWPPF